MKGMIMNTCRYAEFAAQIRDSIYTKFSFNLLWLHSIPISISICISSKSEVSPEQRPLYLRSTINRPAHSLTDVEWSNDETICSWKNVLVR